MAHPSTCLLTLDENLVFILPMVGEVGWEIYVDFFVYSGLSGGFHDDLVRGRVDVLEVVLHVESVFILHLDMKVLCWLSCVLQRLDPRFLSKW